MAASVLQKEPAAIQLRYLQTVSEIATENNSTTLFPIPIDLFRPFLERITGARESAELASAQSSARATPALPSSTPPAADLTRGAPEREPARVKRAE
jgi:hypothetical protein